MAGNLLRLVRSERMHKDRQNNYKRGRIKMLIHMMTLVIVASAKISSANQVRTNETTKLISKQETGETGGNEGEGGLYGQFGRRLSSELAFQVTQTTPTAADTRQQRATSEIEHHHQATGSNTAAKAPPVLRPSLEEVASKLSRKHLNLEHENWRLKPNAADHQNNLQSPSINEAEQEIERPKVGYDDQQQELSPPPPPPISQQATSQVPQNDHPPPASSTISATTDATTSSVTESFYKRPLTSQHQHQHHHQQQQQQQQQEQYLQIDTIASPPKLSVSSLSPTPSSTRRKKSGNGAFQPHLAEQVGDNNELYQCHQYLRRHTSVVSPAATTSAPEAAAQSSSSSASPNQNPLRLQANQLLPCSCEWRKLFWEVGGSGGDGETTVWLSCDNVQLMGSHFYGGGGGEQSEQINSTFNPFKLVRFSQRDAALQTLHSQKFHYLRLAHLRSIDLSKNRIRHIKMDAFHGLETRLEQLNLASNLLGDSRATSATESRGNNNNGQEKLIFLSDELVRLRKLKWLSLQNNQISQLGPSIFIKPTASAPSQQQQQQQQSMNSNRPLAGSLKDSLVEGLNELSYLDLSLNLLQLVPSESIHQLKELEILKLSGNKIVRLDGETKFPNSLKYLDLSENLIRSVRHCNLIDLPKLVEINLSHNQLSQLDKTAFLPSVGHLNLLVSPSPATEAKDTSSRFRARRQATDLDTDESILSSLSDLVTGRAQQVATSSDEVQAVQRPIEFNATLRLNLSFNYFEQVPGDLLLKFPHLQLLDLSHNRIHRLDPNYLCSIYNLVENLRQLDLSGNLMSIFVTNSTAGSVQSSLNNQRQLDKLFGCLQRLEKLNLSTNRLVSSPVVSGQQQEARRQVEIEEDELEAESTNVITNSTSSNDHDNDDRLVIKFGESWHLNALDLSDNQLKWVPIFELVKDSTSAHLGVSSQEIMSNTNNNNWIAVSSRFCAFEVLNLNYNYLERLEEQDFGNQLRNLRQLHLDHNKLSSLPVGVMRQFTSLDQLSVANNRLSTLSPLNELLEGSLRTLRSLNLAHNRLMEWPQINRRLIMAEALGGSNGNQQQQQSEQAEFAQQTPVVFVLEELNLEGNLLSSANVTSLFDQMVYMRHLKLLNLNHNLLTRIKSEWFKFANRNLKKLLLTGNRINNIELGAFAGNQVNQLTQLNLDYNLIKELKRKTFDSMPKIRELDLSHNLIHTINSETFHQVNSMQILRLNNNKLSSWKCEYFSHLCHSISGSINADLIHLAMLNHPPVHTQESSSESPNITELPPASVSSLLELDLSHNSLSQLRANSISVHTKLTRLNLSHNKLSFIPHDLFKATTSAPLTGRQIQLVSSLRYLNLAHNRIQTIDNINFRPLRNLFALDLSHNELQTLGTDVVAMDAKSLQQEQAHRRILVANNLTNLLNLNNDDLELLSVANETSGKQRTGRSVASTLGAQSLASAANWPALARLRHLNLANNQLTMVNQSLLSELSPFSLLNLNLSSNYLDSESLPFAFYTKISSARQQAQDSSSYDLIFTLKLESLDLSHNRLNEFPAYLLDNHYTSMESFNLSHNRIQSVPANSNLMIQIKSLNLDFNPLDRQSNELILFEQKSVRTLNLAATRLFAIQQITASPYTTKEYATHYNNWKQQLANNQTSQLDLIRSISRPINAPYLRHLNLSSNQLVWLAANVFERLHSLETLDLSNNQLTRLHLLNNQLLRVSSSLSKLNLASNLYTSLDGNDFSQLTNLRHLDLSHLLSLQRLDCRFLAKLNTLKSLKMLNYPQLRQSIQNSILTLLQDSNNNNNNNNNKSRHQVFSERLRRKVRNELLVATMGRHCFLAPQENPGEAAVSAKSKWFNLEELELELFNDFSQLDSTVNSVSSSFRLEQELGQLLGPKLKSLTLIGLNLTSLSDESLFGLASDELRLKISYTSMAHLPLRQLLMALSKRTKLELDFRHNNIQSVDASSLQLLDELQLMGDSGDQFSSLKLASNPIRCDCQTRPLWLWLNQRWRLRLDSPVVGDFGGADYGDTNVTNTNIYWLKYKSLGQTSDLRCYYPLKLRNKLTQHVYYNDLVCKGPSAPVPHPATRSSTSRKSNETTYYVTGETESEESTASEEEDYELDYQLLVDQPASVEQVVVTKFNRYRLAVANYSLYFQPTSNFQSAQQQQEGELLATAEASTERSREKGLSLARGESSLYKSRRHINHLPPLNTFHSAFNHFASNRNYYSSASVRQQNLRLTSSWLTDMDVIILTVISITMTVLTFIIITICLFKHKMDQTMVDEEKMIGDHHQRRLLRLVAASQGRHSEFEANRKVLAPKGSYKSSSSSSSSGSTTTGAKRSTTVTFAGAQKASTKADKGRQPMNAAATTKVKKCGSIRLAAQRLQQRGQVLVPMMQNTFLAPTSSAENFLMRSPTIRRMTHNATDWFRFTLRACPPSLRTPRLVSGLYGDDMAQARPVSVACPEHGIAVLQAEGREGQECSDCSHLWAASRRVKQRPSLPPKPAKRINLEDHYNRAESYNTGRGVARELRTFGLSHSKGQQKAGPSAVGSQLPTQDVEGRFAYQSDSQLESPRPISLATSDQTTTCDEHQQGDIFVLVHEEGDAGSQPETTRDDEESGTSSPAAYGFMCSSPSLASTLATAGASLAKVEPNYDNNNDPNYVRGDGKPKSQQEPAVPAQTDGQIIISRL